MLEREGQRPRPRPTQSNYNSTTSRWTNMCTPSTSSTSSDKSPFFAPKPPKGRIIVTTPNGTISQIKDIDEESKSSILGASFNLCNNIIGAGIVGIPFAISQCSLIVGLFMILLLGLMTVKSLRLLIETAKHIDVPTYERLAEASFGKSGFTFISVAMFIMAYGGMVGYLMIIRTNLSYLFGIDHDDRMMKNAVLVVSSLCTILPISCQRDMGNLAKTSIISVMMVCILIGIIVFFSPAAQNIETYGFHELIYKSEFQLTSFFNGLGVLCFAFVCQHSSFIIASSLERPTKQRWDRVTGIAITICSVLAIIMGVAGYMAFLDKTDGDILINLGRYAKKEVAFPIIRHAANTGRGLLCITMLLVYPMELFVARHVCVVLLFKGRRAHEGDDHAILARRDRRVAVTTGLYLLSLLPALIVNDVGKAFALSGALGGATLSYMCPGILYLAVHGEEFLEMVEDKWGYNYVKKYIKQNTRSQNHSSLKQTKKNVRKSTTKNDQNTSLLWNLLLMPLWCRIASYGKEMVENHEEQEALKSPHPYVFGKIIHHHHKYHSDKNGNDHRAGHRNMTYGKDVESVFHHREGKPPLHHRENNEMDSNMFRPASVPNLLKPMNSFTNLKSLESSFGTRSKPMNSFTNLKNLESSLGTSYGSTHSNGTRESKGSKGRSKKVGFQSRDSLGNELHVNEKERLLAEYRPISADSFNAASFEVIRSGPGSSGIFEEDDSDDSVDHRCVIEGSFPQDMLKMDNEEIDKIDSNISYHQDDTDNDSHTSSVFIEDQIDDAMYESDCDSNASSINVSPSPLKQVKQYTVSTTYSKFNNIKLNHDTLRQMNQKGDAISVVTETTVTTQQELSEDDPQDDPPTLLDYCIAAYYIIFGFVAAFAGVFSAINT